MPLLDSNSFFISSCRSVVFLNRIILETNLNDCVFNYIFNKFDVIIIIL